MTKEEANKKLSEAVAAAYAALRVAQAIADEHGLTFSFSAAYGMGGTYIGAKSEENDWQASGGGCSFDQEPEGEWRSSSAGC